MLGIEYESRAHHVICGQQVIRFDRVEENGRRVLLEDLININRESVFYNSWNLGIRQIQLSGNLQRLS